MSLIEKIDAEIAKFNDVYPVCRGEAEIRVRSYLVMLRWFKDMLASEKNEPIGNTEQLTEQKEPCEGCKHNGNYENEVEYGYPSPCTKCKRRCVDNYQPDATDINVTTKTIGDKIRESNESLAEFIKTVTDKCIIGSCRTCPIYIACDQMENKEDLARYFSQPYTE